MSLCSLSYYSLCRVASLTGYANPLAAEKAGVRFTYTVDENGNVLAAAAVNTKENA